MRILEWLGFTAPTKKFKVRCRMGDDGKWLILTPFFPGKGSWSPWKFGDGANPGDEIETCLELVQEEPPLRQHFEEASSQEAPNLVQPAFNRARKLWAAGEVIKT